MAKIKKNIVTTKTVIAGRAYQAEEELQPQHLSKLDNLVRIGHVEVREVDVEDPESKPSKGK